MSFSPRSKFSVTAHFHAYIPDATQTLLFGTQSDTYGPPRMFTAEASVRF